MRFSVLEPQSLLDLKKTPSSSRIEQKAAAPDWSGVFSLLGLCNSYPLGAVQENYFYVVTTAYFRTNYKKVLAPAACVLLLTSSHFPDLIRCLSPDCFGFSNNLPDVMHAEHHSASFFLAVS